MALHVRRGTRPQVHLVTGARRSRYDDIATRQRRYLIRMGVRTVAVVVAFFAPIPFWARIVAILLGLILPWISVTSANIGPLPEPGAHGRARPRALHAGEVIDDEGDQPTTS